MSWHALGWSDVDIETGVDRYHELIAEGHSSFYARVRTTIERDFGWAGRATKECQWRGHGPNPHDTPEAMIDYLTRVGVNENCMELTNLFL